MKKIFKIIFLIVLVISSLILSGILINNQLLEKNIMEDNSFSEVFNIIGENNPINKALAKEIKDIKQSEDERLKSKRLLLIQRIKEESQLAEKERLMEDEKQEEIQRKFKKDYEQLQLTKKIAYLTFDDGPSARSTDLIIDILDEYNIKATFFVVGKMVEKYPKVLQRAFDQGHAIGNHTFSHDYGYIYKNTDNFMKDLERADIAIKQVLGQDFETKVMRFPGGSFGIQKQAMKKLVIESGYMYYDWNSLNGDAEGVLMSNDYLIRRFKQTYKKQIDLIVLMHDTDEKTTTVELLRSIIDFLMNEGYEFKVIDENYKNRM